MHVYGHMLRVRDRTYHTIKSPDGVESVKYRVEVKDIWPSKRLIRNAQGALEGSRWVELWTFGTDVIARPIAIVRSGDFTSWIVDRPYIGDVQIGAARNHYAPSN